MASNDDVVPPLIYADDDASFHSDHLDDENYDQLLGANDDEDGEAGDNCDGGDFDDDIDDARVDGISDGDQDGDDNSDGDRDGDNNSDEDDDDSGELWLHSAGQTYR